MGGEGALPNSALFTMPIAVTKTLAGSVVGCGYAHSYEAMLPEPLDDRYPVNGKFTKYEIVWCEMVGYKTLSTFKEYANSIEYQIAHRVVSVCKP